MRYWNQGPFVVAPKVAIRKLSEEPLLFFDDAIVALASGVNQIVYCPEKLAVPVMTADKPWEHNGKYQCVGGFSGRSIVFREGILQMFYSVYHMGGEREWRSFAYAESTDGISWKKPKIRKGTNLLIDNRGSKIPTDYWELQNVILDERTGYYIGLGHCKLRGRRAGAFIAHTKDPWNWDRKNFRWLFDNTDIHALMGWDDDRCGYVVYPRIMTHTYGYRRAIGYSFSRNLKEWTKPVLVYEPSRQNILQEIYNMPVLKYGGYYLGFPIVYLTYHGNPGTLATGFVVARDGRKWPSAWTNDYVQTGLPGQWDDCYAMSAAPVNFRDRTMFYYWGCNFPHDKGFAEEKENKGSVGLAYLPRDRYCSLASIRHYPARVDLVVLEIPDGNWKLLLNAECGNGKIACKDGSTELQMVRENTVEYRLQKGNSPTWQGPVALQLSIELSDAQIFGIRIAK